MPTTAKSNRDVLILEKKYVKMKQKLKKCLDVILDFRSGIVEKRIVKIYVKMPLATAFFRENVGFFVIKR